MIFDVDVIYQYNKDEELGYKAEIIFSDCIFDACNVLIFNKELMPGEFGGKYIYLTDFIKHYKNMELEILNDGYFGFHSFYNAYLWKKDETVSAHLNIFSMGDLIYRIGERLFKKIYKKQIKGRCMYRLFILI